MLLSRFLSQNIKLFLISLRSFITCHDNKSIKHFPHTINLIGNFSIGELILENDGDSRITINKQKVSKYLSFLINKERLSYLILVPCVIIFIIRFYLVQD
jgi:hypothetical protein